MGLKTLAATVGEETDTIEEVHEPYLMQIGFLQRTARADSHRERLSPPGDRGWRRRGR